MGMLGGLCPPNIPIFLLTPAIYGELSNKKTGVPKPVYNYAIESY